MAKKIGKAKPSAKLSSKQAARQKLFKELKALYADMDAAYDEACAAAPGFTCADCPKNCCVSYFQHHTHVEWLYLWEGIKQLPEATRARYLERAENYVRQSRALLAQGLRPHIICPLNDDGLCGLYEHRLMICRLHGTRHQAPAQTQGQSVTLASAPGCFRYEEAAERADGEVAELDRLPLYRRLAQLEMAYIASLPPAVRDPRTGGVDKVDLTLAEMLVYGPPKNTNR